MTIGHCFTLVGSMGLSKTRMLTERIMWSSQMCANCSRCRQHMRSKLLTVRLLSDHGCCKRMQILP